MDQIMVFLTWLFSDKIGVLCLIGIGIVVAFITAFVLESLTKRRYYNHEKSENDWTLFDDDEEDPQN